MTSPAFQHEELRQLSAALREGSLDAAQASRLNAILAENPAARDIFARYAFLQAMLELDLGGHKAEGRFQLPDETSSSRLPSGIENNAEGGRRKTEEKAGRLVDSGSSVSPSPTLPFSPSSFPPSSVPLPPSISLSSLLPTTPLGNVAFSYAMSAVLVAIGLFIFSLMSAAAPHNAVVNNKPTDSRNHTTPDVPSPAPEPKIVSIARITGTVDCVWVDTDYAPIHDRVVQGDKFMLKSGLMEITYYTGARVILQGPCTYEVESPAGGYLSLGKLTARVEKRSGRGGEGERGRLANSTSPASSASSSSPSLPPSPSPPLFSVRTPTATVTDLGTEFGVEVDKSGAVETLVLDGKVRVAMLTQDGNPGASREVRRGEAVRVAAKDAAIQNVAVQSRRYVRQLPQPRAIRDDFHIAHNYLTEGTSGSIWRGILNAKNASRLDTQPHRIDGIQLDGRLVLAVPKDVNVGWAQPERGRTFKNAPYLYIDVPKGDFDARVRVVLLTEGAWSACGLMARLDDDSFIMVNRNRFSAGYENCATRSGQAGVDADADSYDRQIHGECYLRLLRDGDVFRAYYSVAGKESFWIPIPWGNDSMMLRRPDLKGPMQVGLWYGTFGPIAGSVVFDDFSVQGEVVRQMEQVEKQKINK